MVGFNLKASLRKKRIPPLRKNESLPCKQIHLIGSEFGFSIF